MDVFSVCAGVVAHNPKVDDLNALIENLLACSKWLVIVDNNSSDICYLESLKGRSGVTIVRNHENRGVSRGINQVIEHAREMQAKFVIAFDQDTKISPDLVQVLASDLEKLLEAGEPVAAIGPSVIDDYTNFSLPFINFRLASECQISSRNFGRERAGGRMRLPYQFRVSYADAGDR